MKRPRRWWPTALGLAWTLFLCPVPSLATEPERSPNAPPSPVPAEDYPIYDRIIITKYLTSQTQLVLIDKLTTNRLQPEGPRIAMSYFEDNPVFNDRLPGELLTDFILRNVQPSTLEARFNFGVRYRLVSGDEPEGSEVRAAMPVQIAPPQDAPSRVGRLRLSRVGYSRNLALVYIAEERPDGTGGGLLIVLERDSAGWAILDTEVLWISRRETPPPG